MADLHRAWQLATWLTSHRWHRGAHLLDADVAALGVADSYQRARTQALANWLTNITNRQRPWEECWFRGGPIFVGISAAFQTEDWTPEEVPLRLHARMQETDRKMWEFVGSNHRGERLTFAVRFPQDLNRFGRTLYILARQDARSIQGWLQQHRWFWEGNEDAAGRIAYLLYVLTYLPAKQKTGTGASQVDVHSFDSDTAPLLLRDWQKYAAEFIDWLEDHDEVIDYYERWGDLRKPFRYGQKRLWVSVRDYLRLDYGLFRSGFDDGIVLPAVGDERMLAALEFPGDVWNQRFAQRVLGWNPDQDDLLASAFIRKAWNDLEGRLPAGSSCDDFDVSFDFAQRMCGNGMEDVCPFRGNARHLCPVILGAPVPPRFCPVSATACGYLAPCTPDGCPVTDEDATQTPACDGCGFGR